jgi:hypothetical protein
MKIALYKGRKRLFNRLISFWMDGPYSHVELVFSDGMSASSSNLEGGVRFKYIEFDPALWDFVSISGDEEYARAWFTEHEGSAYDYMGLLGFVVRPVKGVIGNFFCSEAVLASLKYKDPWRFDPNMIASIFSGPQRIEGLKTNDEDLLKKWNFLNQAERKL